MPKRLLPNTKKKAGGWTVIALVLGFMLMNMYSKYLNAQYVAGNGFNMVSYHPWTFPLAIIGGVLWLLASWWRKLGIWWYIPGLFSIGYAIFMLLGGIIYGGWFM